MHRSDETGRLQAVLCIPSSAPADLYRASFRPGLRLSVGGELVRDHADELLPPWLRWVHGTVDLSAAFPHDTHVHENCQCRRVRRALALVVLEALQEMLASERARYEGFWREMGDVVKEAVGRAYATQEAVLDLLLFQSTAAGRLTTLREYVSRMPPGQDDIWYVAEAGREGLADAPDLRAFRDRGWEVLRLASPLDEQVAASIVSFQGRRLRPASDYAALYPAGSPDRTGPARGKVFVGQLKIFRAP